MKCACLSVGSQLGLLVRSQTLVANLKAQSSVICVMICGQDIMMRFSSYLSIGPFEYRASVYMIMPACTYRLQQWRLAQ